MSGDTKQIRPASDGNGVVPGEHYCVLHQGNTSHYAEHNCTVCKLEERIDTLTEENERLRDGRGREPFPSEEKLMQLEARNDALTKERDGWKADAQMFEKQAQESYEECGVLTRRVEELAEELHSVKGHYLKALAQRDTLTRRVEELKTAAQKYVEAETWLRENPLDKEQRVLHKRLAAYDSMGDALKVFRTLAQPSEPDWSRDSALDAPCRCGTNIMTGEVEHYGTCPKSNNQRSEPAGGGTDER